jgi:rubredoxin
MNKYFILCVLSFFLGLSMFQQHPNVNAFTTVVPATNNNKLSSTATTSKTRLHIFGGPKDDGSPGDYKCLDCNYVFTKGPKAWAELPPNWSCPECGSVKRRFKKVPKGSAGGGTPPKKETKKKGMFGF